MTTPKTTSHPDTDEHRAGCVSCMKVHDAKLPDTRPADVLTPEDWVEIYYALDFKLDNDPSMKGQDREARRWRKHLRTILEKIGPDGKNMTGGAA